MDDTTRQCNCKTTSKIPTNINLQFGPNTNNSCKLIPDVEIPDEARDQLKELLKVKYTNILSQTARHIGRTNLIKLDIPTEGPCIATKPYTVPLKYCKFVDYDIEQLEEAGIISWTMNDWASPILEVPKR